MNNNVKRKQLNKLIISILFIILVSYINPLFFSKTQAISQNKDIVISKLEDIEKLDDIKYPGFKTAIKSLKEQHPNWTFTIFKTDLDWNQVLKNESIVKHSRNLVPCGKTGEWLCSVCGTKTYDSGRWCCASEKAVAYYMDARNFLNTENIFQFETLSYVEGTQTIEGVEKIIAGTFMEGDTIEYIDTTGEKASIEKSYAKVIMEAAKTANVSPYHLASRIKQEQGSSVSSTGGGQVSGHIGYYNMFNVNASGSGASAIITNAMIYAEKQGWDNPEKSIIGGAQFLAKSYIGIGQNTLYLQKFDVDNSDGALYYHQYMQNIMAPLNEGKTMYSSYSNLNMLDSQINFLIPVYENMPIEISQLPIDNIVCTENVTLNGNEVNVRTAPNTNSTVITKLNTGDTILRIEQAVATQNGYYWDKIVLNDGAIGYIARDYILKADDIKTCEELAYATTTVNLRNGPGTTGTVVVATLNNNQELKIIDKARYNKDGYIWDRVVLSDGKQGYIASNYLTNKKVTIEEQVKVIAEGGLILRSSPGTSSSTITVIDQNIIVTRLEKGTELITGYYWDKIRTTNGLEGYVASNYLQIISKQEEIDEPDVKEDEQLLITPETTIENLKQKYSKQTIIIKDKKGNKLEDNAELGTGATIQINNVINTIIKIGDISGDAKVTSADYILVKNYIMQKKELDKIEIKAADINKDGKITSADYILIKNYIMGKITISI